MEEYGGAETRQGRDVVRKSRELEEEEEVLESEEFDLGHGLLSLVLKLGEYFTRVAA